MNDNVSDLLADIAKNKLWLEKPKTKQSASLDFQPCSFKMVMSALRAAYEAGQQNQNNTTLVNKRSDITNKRSS